jgi:ubiquinone/menaquinone biosynthesis C-methylase UbiE
MNETIKALPAGIIKVPLYRTQNNIYSCLDANTASPYDVKARAYEWLVSQYTYNKVMWGTTPCYYFDFAKQLLEKEAPLRLDVGCGGLSQTAELYAQLKSTAVLLDSSERMLQLGKRLILKQNKRMPANLLFLQADALHLPFYEEVFDQVMSFGMIHLFNDKAQFIAEALRVLKPKGTFGFSVLTNNRKLSRKYLNLLFEKGEVGKPVSSGEILELFHSLGHAFTYYRVGSMLFISGSKQPENESF